MAKASAKMAQAAATAREFSRTMAVPEGRTMQYMWLMRVFVSLTLFLLFSSICMSLSLMQLSSRLRVLPFLVADQNASNEVARAEPIEQSMDSILRVREMFVRFYVLKRETVWLDEEEMNTTINSYMPRLSTGSVYRTYLREFLPQYEAQKTTRPSSKEVNIVHVIADTPSVWQVYFEIWEYQPEMIEPIIKTYSSAITIKSDPSFQNWLRRLKNPLGLYVEAYMRSEYNRY